MLFKFSSEILDSRYPARYITDRLKRNLLFSQLALWFGFVFFLGGLIPSILTFPQMTWRSGPDKDAVTGKLLAIASAHYSENEVPYYQYSYTYNIQGKQYFGSSYDKANDMKEGTDVTIVYDQEEPSLSRIKGMRMKPIYGWLILFFLIFIIAGIMIMISGAHSYRNILSYVQQGIKVEAMVHRIVRVTKGEDDSYNVFITYTTKQKEEIKMLLNITELKSISINKTAKVIYLPWSPREAMFYRHFSEECKAVINKNPLIGIS